jgi:flagellar biosynthesis protein FlhB
MGQGSSESKPHAPTPKRLREARERAQVAKSTELAGAASLLCTLACVVVTAPWAAMRISEFQLLVNRSVESVSLFAVESAMRQSLMLMAQLSFIPLGVAAGVFVLALWLQTGTVFNLELVQPKLERLDPVEGVRRTFSLRSLVRLLTMVLKAVVVTAAATLICLHVLGDAVRVVYADAGAALAVANAALTGLLLWCGSAFVLLGGLDLVYQRWQFRHDLRMSHGEVRRERRDLEGDAKFKSHRKGFAKEALPREQLAFMHMASLVVRDARQRVVVLIYRPRQHPLPLCLVRGSADFGQEILALARQRKRPVVDDSPLLAAIFPAARPGASIPPHHLTAVLHHLAMAAA